MLKQNLSQKQLQKLSPQQIQLIKLLQIPTATLDQRIKEELESNPALDEGDSNNEVFDIEDSNDSDREEEFELDDYLKDYIEDDPTSYKLRANNYGGDLEEKNVPIAVESTFHEKLERQLGMIENLSAEEETIALQIIGSIDQDGYLRRDLQSIVDDLMFSQGMMTTVDAIERILGIIQLLDPPGVGARDLQECLLIQLEQKMSKSDDENHDHKLLAYKILKDSFVKFSKKHYTKLQRTYEISQSELKAAIDEILKLNPKPASGMAESRDITQQYVVPDFIIRNRDGELELTLNSKNAPDLQINDNYLEMLKGFQDNHRGERKASKKEKEAVLFIKQKIDAAKWFIDAIKQRQDTLFRTMYVIMQYQHDFFMTGDERFLKPMILKDIAEITGLDISTISRVASSKFVQTEFGTKKLKDFFSESMQAQDGTEVSTLEIKNILTDVVNSENKIKPLSDEKLKDILSEKGYNIARRTIAKYREQLGIPVARLRKEL